jgi:hypothetical protein
MVAVIDDNYSFFSRYIKPNGYFLYRLSYTDISHVCEESIVINDKSTSVRPLIYKYSNDRNGTI